MKEVDGEDRKLNLSSQGLGKLADVAVEFSKQLHGGRRKWVFGEPVKKARVPGRKRGEREKLFFSFSEVCSAPAPTPG